MRSVSGELTLDYGNGICKLNGPNVQAVTGFVGPSGSFRLGDVLIESGNDYATVLVVAMDDRPLNRSERILVQVGTIERPTGWKTRPATIEVEGQPREGQKVVNFGTAPWQIVEADVVVSIANDSLARAAVRDPNGMPTSEVALEEADGMQRFRFPADALYVVLE